MDDLVAHIKGAHNGTEVYNIDGYDDAESLTPMWEQVTNIKAKMLPIMQQAKDGINLICFSQGESDLHCSVVSNNCVSLQGV